MLFFALCLGLGSPCFTISNESLLTSAPTREAWPFHTHCSTILNSLLRCVVDCCSLDSYYYWQRIDLSPKVYIMLCWARPRERLPAVRTLYHPEIALYLFFDDIRLTRLLLCFSGRVLSVKWRTIYYCHDIVYHSMSCRFFCVWKPSNFSCSFICGCILMMQFFGSLRALVSLICNSLVCQRNCTHSSLSHTKWRNVTVPAHSIMGRIWWKSLSWRIHLRPLIISLVVVWAM